MITAVSVEHWRSHLRSEFSFGPGVNVLVGMMGGGKSSVLDAVCFALYGTFPALQQRRVSLDELLHKAPQQRTGAEVAVEFTRSGKRYRVARRIALGKGTAEAELREEGELREANPGNVTREV
ncbi:MAG TPA: AAA family ATPase, partial [archaeon]|nr:AAA family ATPase [archaeon]